MESMILPLRRYAQFSGRSARGEFWMWVLFVIIVSILLSVIDGALHLGGATRFGSERYAAPDFLAYSYAAGVKGGVLTWIFAIAIVIPNLAVSVRRLHDIDRSGWWLLAWMVPYCLGSALALGGIETQNIALPLVGGLLMVIAFLAIVVLIVWYCMRGTRGPNRFGPDPLEPLDQTSR